MDNNAVTVQMQRTFAVAAQYIGSRFEITQIRLREPFVVLPVNRQRVVV